jgi:hypothetical protein
LIWIVLLGGAALLSFFVYLKNSEPYAREKRMLKDWLRRLRIEPRVFSDECLTEMLEIGMSHERRTLTASEYEQRLPGGIQGIAGNIRWICLGEDDCSAAKIKDAVQKGYPHVNVFWEILAKHDPKRFSLDELEMTQATNRSISSS